MGNGRGDAMKGMGAYTVAKFGLSGLLTVLAADYSWLNVRSISPGFTETPMLAAFDPRFIEMVRQRKPFRRADDVAEEIFGVFENSTPDKANA